MPPLQRANEAHQNNSPLPELHVFECMRCGEVDTFEVPEPQG